MAAEKTKHKKEAQIMVSVSINNSKNYCSLDLNTVYCSHLQVPPIRKAGSQAWKNEASVTIPDGFGPSYC